MKNPTPNDAVLSETIALPGFEGAYIEGYLSRPLSGGPHPTVVVLHHLPGGYDEESKDVARRFGAKGYLTVMPNLHYRRGQGLPPEQASAHIRANGGRPLDEVVGDAAGAIELARNLPGSNSKVAIVGFCAGGKEAYVTSCRLSVDAVVTAWGGGLSPKGAPGDPTGRDLQFEQAGGTWPIEEAASLGAPLLGLYGGRDTNPSPHAARRLDDRLTELGKPHTIHLFPEAAHAFINPETPAFVREAAQQCWRLIWEFLEQQMQ